MEAYLDDESESMVNLPLDMYMECYEYMACPTPREEAPTESPVAGDGTTELDEQIRNRSDELDNQLEAARLELETLQTAVHEGLSGAGSGTAEGLAQGAPSRGHGGSRKRALRASRKEEASPAFSQGPRGSSLRETSPFEEMGDKWSGLSGPSLKGSVGQGVEGLAWPFVKGPARQQRSEASMSASGEGRAATPSLFTLSSSLPEVYSTSAYLRDSEVHEGDATMASESPATEAEGRETQSDRGSEPMDLNYPFGRTSDRRDRTSREGSTAGTPRARGVVEGLRSPLGAAGPSGRGLRTSNSSGRLPVPPPGLRSSGVVVSPSSQRSQVQQPDVQQRKMERVIEDNQRLHRQLDSQASWIARHKEELARLRKAEVEGKQREATLLAQNTRLGTQVADLRTDASRLMTHHQELAALVEERGEELAAVREEMAQQTARAERAEAEADQRVRRHAEVVAAERRADKEATLQRLAHFQQQLDTAVQQFKGARGQIDRLQSTNRKLKEDLKAAHTVVARHEEELQRRKHAMQELTTENRGLADQYANLMQQHRDDVAALRSRVKDHQALKARCSELEEALAAAELELESDTDHRRQFTSLLEVVEEQQGMVVELKEKQQTLQSEIQRLLVQEADWRARSRQWQRERALFEREQRNLKHQLERAFRSEHTKSFEN